MKYRLLLPVLALLASCHTPQDDKRQTYLDFLYASMPLPDSVDYPRQYWLENIDYALSAREEMPWGKTIPEREWRHFVLPVRVNNENLDESRKVFYEELKPRLAGLTMTEAILEVNHWCHEHVTYQPSDERTSSPLATVRSAIGRCGEESTFLVAALRSVGIPARQVYTPRWAHTDDNHAWVEAWADGEWHFLGACEPEPVLDLGWFNAPASRAMLMHTKVFGHYDGPEEVMQRNRCYTEIDVTANYAPVARRYVKVTDSEGHAIEGATVEYKIYNYAEFYTVATRETDAQGISSMQAGKGDLVVWASHNGDYNFALLDMRAEASDTLTIALTHHPGESFSADLTIVPPVERNTLPVVTEQQRADNNRRLAYEDSLRNAYVATFSDRDEILRAARGNASTLADFTSQNDSLRCYILYQTLTAKDLRDVTFDVLADHYHYVADRDSLIPTETYNQYVLNPRVANEMLTCYKQKLQEELDTLTETFRRQPEQLVAWVSTQISIDATRNPQSLRMSPMGVWRHRTTDAVSRDIFFVALARTCGIPAYRDPVNGDLWYYNVAEKEWHQVLFDDDADSEATAASDNDALITTGTIHLQYKATKQLPDPKYYIHFTLSKLEQGRASLLNFGEEETLASLAASGRSYTTGDYLLITGTRLANGSVLAHLEVRPVQAGQTATLPISFRRSTDVYEVIGNFDCSHVQRQFPQLARGFYVLGLIAPSNEPTNHALRDIGQYQAAFDEWGAQLFLVFKDEEEKARFDASAFNTLPANLFWGVDDQGTILNELTQALHLSAHPTMPLFVIADTFNRIVFCSEGYTIGLGERLLQVKGQ